MAKTAGESWDSETKGKAENGDLGTSILPDTAPDESSLGRRPFNDGHTAASPCSPLQDVALDARPEHSPSTPTSSFVRHAIPATP